MNGRMLVEPDNPVHLRDQWRFALCGGSWYFATDYLTEVTCPQCLAMIKSWEDAKQEAFLALHRNLILELERSLC